MERTGFRRLAAVASISVWGVAPLAAEPAWTGYRGPEGSGVFAASRPPVDCNLASGRNVRWRAPLPNWGHAMPLAVKDRVFVLSEPGWKHDWPVLTCIAAKDGKLLWEREIDHLPATGLPAARQEEARKQWHDLQAEYRKLYTIFAETVGQGDQEAAKARFKDLGYNFGGHSGGGYGQLRKLGGRPRLRLNDVGLRSDVWRHDCGLGYDEIGAAFATPVSDGRHVFVTVSRSAVACFDFEGRLLWLTYVPFPKELSGYNESNGRSPILWRDLLISDHSGHTLALDKATGRILWQAKTFGGGIATPVIITVSDPASGAGVDVLLTEGHQGKGGGIHAIRLPEGRSLKLAAAKLDKGGAITLENLLSGSDEAEESMLPPPSLPKTGGWGPGGNSMMVNTDHRNVAYFSSGCHTGFQGRTVDNPDQPLWTKLPAAVRFKLGAAPDTLEAEVLWHGGTFRGKPPSHIPMVYHGGKLYIGDVVLDALTGEMLAGGRQNPVLPPTRHILLLAGDRFYGIAGPPGLADRPPPADKPVATLTCTALDGRLLGESPLFAAPVDEEKKVQIRSQVGWDRWGFGYGMPFTIGGDSLYLRSNDELICVANARS